DAVPMTLGQEFSGWVSLLDRDLARLRQVLDGLYDLAIGGTAIGTGINTHPEFAERAARKIAELAGLPFRSHPNKFAALSAHAVTLISDACHGFVDFMITGIQANTEKLDYYVKNSLMLVTALAPKVGYDKAAKIAHTAHCDHSTLREAALKLGYLTGEEFDAAVRPEEMVRP